jgi:Fic family protein
MYNWENQDWPDFQYQLESLSEPLKNLSDVLQPLLDKVRSLPEDDRRHYFIEVLVAEAQKTSKIEGEFVSREDLRSSILNHLYLGNYQRNVRDLRAVGIGKLLSTVASNFSNNITETTLKYWHQILFNRLPSLDIIGDYRVSKEPMQIVSGPDYDLTIHYEAPPSVRVPEEMTNLVASLARPQHPDRLLDFVLRAGVSHVHFESIHPFQDGNGRIGRAMIDHLISQGIGFVIPFSISQVFADNQKEYYAQLNTASRTLDLGKWLTYFVESVIAAVTNANEQISFLLAKTVFFDRFEDQLNDRQTKLIRRLFDAGPEGFQGGLSAKNYERLTRASKATATRELTELTQIGALIRIGAGRGTRYELRLDD